MTAWRLVATREQRPGEQEPALDGVATQTGAVGQDDHVGGQPGGPLQVTGRAAARAHPGPAPGCRTAHGRVSRSTSAAAKDGSRWRSSGLGEQCHAVLGDGAGIGDDGPGRGRRLGRAALLEGDPGQQGARRQRDPALVLVVAGGEEVGEGRGRLAEGAPGDLDVGQGAGGLPGDLGARAQVEGPPGLGLGLDQRPGVEVHLGADRGVLGQLVIGIGRAERVLVGAVEQPEALVGARAPRRRRCRRGGPPGRRSRPDRRR